MSVALAGRLATRSAARSHVGRVRSINEDRLLDRSDRGVWAVADGMGGHCAGGEAAATAIAALADLADADALVTSATLIAALEAASRRIAGRQAPNAPSGTTAVALLLDGAEATVAWAGDSRCYLIRDGAGRQLTRDHSVVQDLVDAGLLAAAAAADHPRANVITRALGVEPLGGIDTASVRVATGDLLLLCSDGLSRSLAERDFAAAGTLDERADRLLANALDRDGSDNISLLLIAIDG